MSLKKSECQKRGEEFDHSFNPETISSRAVERAISGLQGMDGKQKARVCHAPTIAANARQLSLLQKNMDGRAKLGELTGSPPPGSFRQAKKRNETRTDSSPTEEPITPAVAVQIVKEATVNAHQFISKLSRHMGSNKAGGTYVDTLSNLNIAMDSPAAMARDVTAVCIAHYNKGFKKSRWEQLKSRYTHEEELKDCPSWLDDLPPIDAKVFADTTVGINRQEMDDLIRQWSAFASKQDLNLKGYDGTRNYHLVDQDCSDGDSDEGWHEEIEDAEQEEPMEEPMEWPALVDIAGRGITVSKEKTVQRENVIKLKTNPKEVVKAYHDVFFGKDAAGGGTVYDTTNVPEDMKERCLYEV